MKDLGETQYILRIKVLKDYKSRKIATSQATYILKLLVKYMLQNVRKVCSPSGMKFIFLRINVMRHRRRKIIGA